MIFFNPDQDMVKWLIKYANGRIVIDAGCGPEMHLLQMMQGLGYSKAAGIDPFINMASYQLIRANAVNSNNDHMFHALPGWIQKWADLYDKPSKHKDVMLLFARPCHGKWVKEALAIKHPSIEALYITTPSNVTSTVMRNDLGEFYSRAKPVIFEGTSKDKELVFSIR